jgi:hypothetical protein
MTNDEMDALLEQWRERTKDRVDPKPEPHVHRWGTAYNSSSGRRVCVECGFVTDAPFEALGVGERAKAQP